MSTVTGQNVIVLKDSAGSRKEEMVAAAAITPGHLVYENTSGLAAVHATEGGYAERLFAEEDALQGRTIDDDYAASDQVFLHVAMPGDVIYAWLKAGENVSIGANLVSAGDGTLIDEGSVGSGVTVKQIVGKAVEAKDLSASGAVASRIAIRIL